MGLFLCQLQTSQFVTFPIQQFPNLQSRHQSFEAMTDPYRCPVQIWLPCPKTFSEALFSRAESTRIFLVSRQKRAQLCFLLGVPFIVCAPKSQCGLPFAFYILLSKKHSAHSVTLNRFIFHRFIQAVPLSSFAVLLDTQ